MKHLLLLLALAAIVSSISKDEVWDKIVDIVGKEKNGEYGNVRDSLDKDMRNDLGYDDIDVIEIHQALEEKLDILIPDEDAADLKTYAQLRDYVYNKLNNKSKTAFSEHLDKYLYRLLETFY